MKCKNCNSQVNQKFCPNCGRASQLKRIDWNYIKDEVRSVFYFDKGIFYTIKELLIRPGKSLREYLTEDRTKLLKPIIFVIITSLAYTLVNSLLQVEEQLVDFNEELNATVTGSILRWIQGNYGYASILMSVFIAFFMKLFFRKTDYNYYETLVSVLFIMGMNMLIYMLFALIQGISHFNIMQASAVVSFIYTTYAIADFYNRRKPINYLKAIVAYILGSVVFFAIVIFSGIIIDSVLNNSLQ